MSGAARENRRKAVFAFRAKMDKPFKTINEQIAILEARGMEVGASAYEALSREGYYSVVNGYKDLFLDARQSKREGR